MLRYSGMIFHSLALFCEPLEPFSPQISSNLTVMVLRMPLLSLAAPQQTMAVSGLSGGQSQERRQDRDVGIASPRGDQLKVCGEGRLRSKQHHEEGEHGPPQFVEICRVSESFHQPTEINHIM